MEIHGVPEYVIVSGRICVDECNLKAVHGYGRYVETLVYPSYVYDLLNDKEKVGFQECKLFKKNYNNIHKIVKILFVRISIERSQVLLPVKTRIVEFFDSFE